jgi:hypothetical protein
MTTFKEIRGTTIEVVSSDPANPEVGQIWYNSSSGTLKGRLALTAGWASGNNMNTGRRGTLVCAGGTQTAALAAGGYDGSTSVPGFTESYNGSWTNVSSLNTGRYAGAGFGTQTAFIAAGGYSFPPNTFSDITESWNGTSWTNLPATSGSTSFYKTGTGTQTAGLVVGYGSTQNQLWNGSAWTTNPATMNNSLNSRGVSGTQTSAIAAGGQSPKSTASESYNGTSWTSTPSLNTARYFLGAGGGSNTSSIMFAGNTDPGGSYTTATELWNGTAWTATSGLAVAKNAVGSAGTQTAALCFAGEGPGGSHLNTTEIWTGPGSYTTKTITVS